jgi:hypothetical protein
VVPAPERLEAPSGYSLVGLINETDGVVSTLNSNYWKIDKENNVTAQSDWFVGER